MTRPQRTSLRMDLQTRRARRWISGHSLDVSVAWEAVFGDHFYNLRYQYRSYTQVALDWREWGFSVVHGHDPLDPDYDDDIPFAYIHGGWNYDGPHVYPGWGDATHGVDWNFDTDFAAHSYLTDHTRGSEYVQGIPYYNPYLGTSTSDDFGPPRPRGVI